MADLDPPPVAGARRAPLRLAHLDQVEQIEREAFASPWRREHFRFEIRENRYAVNHAVLLGDRVLAYACVWEIDEELKINNIAVRADMRRRGLGRWLLLRILEEARRRGRRVARLEVRPSNRAAIRLYRALGFHEVGRRKNYYQREGEDALVLEAPL